MENQSTNIQELNGEDLLAVRGGDYVEATLGLIIGIAFGAGVMVATPVGAPLVGVAIAAGGALLLADAVLSGNH